MKNKHCQCNEYNCLLDYIYPNSDASIACDSDCYFESEENLEYLESYKKTHPETFENFNKAIEISKIIDKYEKIKCPNCGYSYNGLKFDGYDNVGDEKWSCKYCGNKFTEKLILKKNI